MTVFDKYGNQIEHCIIDINQTVNGCNLFEVEVFENEIDAWYVEYLGEGEYFRIRPYEYDTKELVDYNSSFDTEIEIIKVF